MMEMERFDSVWDALNDDKTVAANKKIRSEMMMRLTNGIAHWNLTQTEAAKRLNISQPRLNDLLKGKLSKFSLDALLALAVKAGLEVELRIKEAA